MPTTSEGFYYPDSSTSLSLVTILAAMAASSDTVAKRIPTVFATVSARNAALPTPTEGQLSYTLDYDILWYYSGSAWRPVGVPTFASIAARDAALPAPSLGDKCIVSATGAEYKCVVAGAWKLWDTPQWFNDFAMGANWSGMDLYYTVRSGSVVFRGELYGTAATNTVAFTMPAGVRPRQRSVWNLPRSTVLAAAAGSIATDGTFLVNGTIPATTPGLNLGGCSFAM